MKFTTQEAACHNLRQMGKQFICPKDEFFGPLADHIEKLSAENERLKAALVQIEEMTWGGKGESAVHLIAQAAINGQDVRR